MGETKIEWTDATWNPIAGCSIVSAECKNCYAMRQAHRLANNFGQEKYAGTTEIRNGFPVWTGKLNIDREALEIPFRTKKPKTFFVNSMSDWCHESLEYGDWCAIWTEMIMNERHTFQCLTKRAERQRDLVNAWIHHMRAETLRPSPNIWLGVSVGNRLALPRIDALRETIAAVRFLSCEPLLEDLGAINLAGIHWVIVGGESGPKARPMQPGWARSVRDQCIAANVPFFFKQWGEFAPSKLETVQGGAINKTNGRYHHIRDLTDRGVMKRLGKHAAGRLLDGREYREFPNV